MVKLHDLASATERPQHARKLRRRIHPNFVAAVVVYRNDVDQRSEAALIAAVFAQYHEVFAFACMPGNPTVQLSSLCWIKHLPMRVMRARRLTAAWIFGRKCATLRLWVPDARGLQVSTPAGHPWTGALCARRAGREGSDPSRFQFKYSQKRACARQSRSTQATERNACDCPENCWQPDSVGL